MDVTRRGFLEALGTGAAAATLPLPLAGKAFAAAKSDSIGQHVRTDILLNSNENAYGPSPRVLKALRDGVSEAHRYPDKARKELPEKIAKLHHVSADQVLIGCGSVEILRVAAQAFTGPGRKLVMASPTFEVPGRFSEALGAEVVRVPLNRDFAHDLPAMLAAMGNDTGLVYLCNPNNPTASITPRREIEAFIAKMPAQTFLLVDEAYHHFATESHDYVSFLDRPASNDRVLVARTFSKVYGLAGMRLGYGIGSLPIHAPGAPAKACADRLSCQLRDDGRQPARPGRDRLLQKAGSSGGAGLSSARHPSARQFRTAARNGRILAGF